MTTSADVTKTGTKPIVAAVDGATDNSSAVDWAANEAARSGLPLRVVTVTETAVMQTPPYVLEPIEFDHAAHLRSVLDGTASNLRRTHADVQIDTGVRVDDPVLGLVAEAQDATMLVVGKRGLGAVKRLTVGSTSIALAGRSPAPTVVVPDTWTAADNDGESILVGLDINQESDELLGFAFARAAELGVPLVVMHVWDTHPAVVPSDADVKRWGDEARAAVEAAIAPWREKFPDVQALAAQRHAHHAQGLLDAGDHAQLVVLGRHTVGHSPLGLPLRSTTRKVLHYCERPVAVVPTAVDS
ncbi:MAG TPA: universal stress protein [Nocardioidaceae bacterium]|nr:universal stress protein [Nocardioidaceae bacterium]